MRYVNNGRMVGLWLVLVVILAACGHVTATGGDATPSVNVAPTAPPSDVAPTTAPTTFPTVVPETTIPTIGGGVAIDVLVVYELSGCFAGVQETMTVYTDGRLQWTDRSGLVKRGNASAAQIGDLQTKLQATSQFDTFPNMIPPDACVYSFTATTADGQPFSVTTYDGAQHPPEFAEAVQALRELSEQVN